MSADQDLDRNEDASPFKLEEAKKRGQVAKSADTLSLAVLAVATIGCFALVPAALRSMGGLLARGMLAPASHLDAPSSALLFLSRELTAALLVVAPLMFILVVVVVAVHVLQTGPVFSTHPLKPDWSRLNPATGFKRLLSMKLLYEAAKSVLKLLALTLIAGVALSALAPGVVQLQAASVKTFLSSLVAAGGGVGAKLCVVLAIFAVVDLVYTRWDYLRTLRMSKREVTDEHKQRDGDPRIKARLRELRQEFLRRTRAVSKVPEADVLITNPTRIAIALRYRHGASPAPQVLAKGAGGLARRMRDKAYRANVPVVQSPVLARALFKEVAQESYVPERWYPQVAKILVWVQTAKAARSRRGAAQGSAA